MSVDLGYLDPGMSTLHTVKLADGTYRLSFRARCPSYWYRATARHQSGLVNLTEVFTDVGAQAVPHLGEDVADVQEDMSGREVDESIVRTIGPDAPQLSARRSYRGTKPEVPPKRPTEEAIGMETSPQVEDEGPALKGKGRKRKHPRV